MPCPQKVILLAVNCRYNHVMLVMQTVFVNMAEPAIMFLVILR